MIKIGRFTKAEKIKIIIAGFLSEINKLYSGIDCSIILDEKRVNLSKVNINKFNIDTNTELYLEGFKSISKCRVLIKSRTEEFFKNFNLIDNRIIEYRTKNINSIFAKIYHYIYEKKERGEIPIKKCLNDLFGVRIILPIRKFDKLKQLLQGVCNGNKSLKLIDSSKGDYKAMHIYLIKDNYCMQWEIQFWLKRDDRKNRDSHEKYKQEYTKWEKILNSGEIITIRKN